MSALSADCARAGGLTSLSSFTFTVHRGCSTYEWMDGTLSLLKDSPLESVQFNTTNLFPDRKAPVDRFCMQIVDQHRDHLIRFSSHGLQLGLSSLSYLCFHCTKLEELFILVDHSSVTDVVCILYFHAPVLMFQSLGTPYTGTCASEASACGTYRYQWATRAMQPLRPCVEHCSSVQSNHISGWDRNKCLEGG